MRRRFFWAMVIVAVVTLTAGGFAAALLVNRSVDSSQRAEFSRQAEATARLIQDELDAVREGTDTAAALTKSLGDVLAIVGAVGGHDYVEATLVTRRGELSALGDGAVLVSQVPRITELRRPLQFDAEVDGTTVAALAQPVDIGPRGTVVVVIGTSLELVPWRDLFVRFAWALGVGALLASLLAGWLSRRVGSRLDDLSTASRHFADGDLDARVVVRGDDEVAEVGVAFNEMASELQDARRREREFLVSVGHDLRTPLTTITGYAEAIEEGKVLDDDMARVASVLGRESDRLRRLVEDLMLLSRIEASEFSLRPEPVDLAGHLKGVLESFRGRSEEARVVLEADLDDVGTVYVDADRIAQVVGNLMENALRYTPEAGSVRLGLGARHGLVRIEVADTGPGIEAEDVPHIFERLYVTQRYRPVRPEGSGLGLSIVSELVRAMGGRTEVSSAVGRGTTIAVVLPAEPTHN